MHTSAQAGHSCHRLSWLGWDPLAWQAGTRRAAADALLQTIPRQRQRPHTGAELQLWSSVRGRLASLAEIQDNTEDTLASIEELQSRYAGFGSSISDDESASTRVKKEERDDGDSDLADDDDQDDEKAEIKRKLAEAYAKLLVESEQERK